MDLDFWPATDESARDAEVPRVRGDRPDGYRANNRLPNGGRPRAPDVTHRGDRLVPHASERPVRR